MFGIVNAPNNPCAPVAAPNSGGLRVVLFVNGVEEWRGSLFDFLMENSFAIPDVRDMALKLGRNEPFIFGGGAAPTFRLERETPPTSASNLITLTLTILESGHKFTAQGVTILAALGKIDEQIFALFGSSLGDDDAFDMTECFAVLSGARVFCTYRRRDLSTPEQNFDLTVDGGAS